jgi:hypothetical protein
VKSNYEVIEKSTSFPVFHGFFVAWIILHASEKHLSNYARCIRTYGNTKCFSRLAGLDGLHPVSRTPS